MQVSETIIPFISFTTDVFFLQPSWSKLYAAFSFWQRKQELQVHIKLVP